MLPLTATPRCTDKKPGERNSPQIQQIQSSPWKKPSLRGIKGMICAWKSQLERAPGPHFAASCAKATGKCPQERAAPSSSPDPWNSRSLDTNPRGQQHFQPGFWEFHSWGSSWKGGQGRIWDLGTRERRCGMGLSLSRAKTGAQIQGFLSSPDKFPVPPHKKKAMKRHSDVTVRGKKGIFSSLWGWGRLRICSPGSSQASWALSWLLGTGHEGIFL